MENPILDISLQEEALGTKLGQNIALLSEKTEVLSTETVAPENDENIVDIDETDPEHPLNWPLWRKWSIVSCTALMFMLSYVHVSLNLSPTASLRDLQNSQRLATIYLMPLNTVIWVLSPLFQQYHE